jgi:tetratricopeptide (TPR) repeat protein
MRGALMLIVACMLYAASPASAQTYDQAYQRCLRKPDLDPAMNRICTIVIDSPKTSPRDRAIALNNRTVTASDMDEAIRDLTTAIRLAPRLAKLYSRRGEYIAIPFIKEAIADFNKAISLDPGYAVAWNNRGEVYKLIAKRDAAIRDFTEAIRLAPRYVHAKYNPYEQRAQLKEEKGDEKGAAADRALYAPLLRRARQGGDDLRGPHASGLRAWEPYIIKQ